MPEGSMHVETHRDSCPNGIAKQMADNSQYEGSRKISPLQLDRAGLQLVQIGGDVITDCNNGGNQ